MSKVKNHHKSALDAREEKFAATNDKQDEHHAQDLKHRANLVSEVEALKGLIASRKVRPSFDKAQR